MYRLVCYLYLLSNATYMYAVSMFTSCTTTTQLSLPKLQHFYAYILRELF